VLDAPSRKIELRVFFKVDSQPDLEGDDREDDRGLEEVIVVDEETTRPVIRTVPEGEEETGHVQHGRSLGVAVVAAGFFVVVAAGFFVVVT